MTNPIRIGVIGGSGVYAMDELENVREISVDTPFGKPSDNFIAGTLDGTPVVFLPRHGRGHRISPTRLNYRANIWGFKSLGVEYLMSISACGSLQEHLEPSHIVIPDQLFDRTRLRHLSFFDDPDIGTAGLVVHVSLAEPFCPTLSRVCYDAVQATGNTVHKGGTLIVIEGPRFSTKGESQIFRQWGCDIIGMTAVPEAQLAREAGMSYATMAHVTDYDVWHESEEAVTADTVIRVLLHNADVAKAAVRNAVRLLADAGPSPQADALKDAVITDKSKIPAVIKERFALLVEKFLD